MKKKACC